MPRLAINLVAIDPGTYESAVCIIDTYGKFGARKMKNEELLAALPGMDDHFLAIETITSYGMPVGQEVFDTAIWIGRFIQAHGGRNHRRVTRKEVKIHLCNSLKANDAAIRQALIDRFGPKGTKHNQGRLYGFKSDMYSALAIGLTALDTCV